jgi:DNA-binding phage protein
MTPTIKHDDWLVEQLKDAEFAAEFLNAASEDDDPKTYLTARGEVRRIISMRKANDREKALFTRHMG